MTGSMYIRDLHKKRSEMEQQILDGAKARDGKTSFPPLRRVTKQKKSSRKQLVRCPLCGRLLPLPLIDIHLENSTCNKSLIQTPSKEGGKEAEIVASNTSETSHFCLRAAPTVADEYEACRGQTRRLSCVWTDSAHCCKQGVADGRGDFSAVVTLKKWLVGCDLKLVLLAHTDLGPGNSAKHCVSYSTQPGCPSKYLAPSVLKSALQKCIRRGRVGPAVRIAVAFMRKVSFVELLRRFVFKFDLSCTFRSRYLVEY